VVAHQVIRGTCDRHALWEQSHFQLAQVLFAAAVRMGDERMYKDAAPRIILQSAFNLFAIEGKIAISTLFLAPMPSISNFIPSSCWTMSLRSNLHQLLLY
jgi:hypothetical protein